MIKIIHVNNVADVSVKLVKGLREIGYEANLLRVKIPIRKANVVFKILLSPFRLISFCKINNKIKKENYDIVHIHYAYFGWLGILGRYDYFLHCHGSDIRYKLNNWLSKRWIIPCLKKAKIVFYSTPDLYNVIKNVRPDAIFLPNPIIIPEKIEKIRKNKNIRILLFSYLDDRLKGTNIAVDALDRIRRKHSNIEINAILHGRDKNKYNTLKWIKYYEYIKNDNIFNFIKEYDIIIGQFALGSLGISEYEAMACGKPVVSYFKYKNVYNSMPPIISCKNSKEIVENIEKYIINEHQRNKIGRDAKKWVEMNHDYKNVTKELVKYYINR